MAEFVRWDFEERSSLLFFHFDVEGHYLSLETFIHTAESARRVIAALDKTFFNGALEYELIVVPPEEGTFLSKLGVWVLGGTTAVFTFVNTDVGGALVEGLTGHPPSHWATKTGEATKDALYTATEFIEIDEEDEGPEQRGASKNKAACREAARITTMITQAILESSPESLTRVGMEVGALPDAMDARADFYLACIEDQKVRRIGFTPGDDFPIPRNSFPERAVRPDRKEPDEIPLEWIVSIESIYVTSPNWDEEDQKSRRMERKGSNPA